MIKRKTTKSVKEFDESGRLIKEIVTETVEDDDTQYLPYYQQFQSAPGKVWCGVSDAPQGGCQCKE